MYHQWCLMSNLDQPLQCVLQGAVVFDLRVFAYTMLDKDAHLAQVLAEEITSYRLYRCCNPSLPFGQQDEMCAQRANQCKGSTGLYAKDGKGCIFLISALVWREHLELDLCVTAW